MIVILPQDIGTIKERSNNKGLDMIEFNVFGEKITLGWGETDKTDEARQIWRDAFNLLMNADKPFA